MTSSVLASGAIKNVLVMAAGTGGHIFPALAVARQLKAQGVQVFWLATPTGMEHRLVDANEIPLYSIQIEGLRGNGIKRLLKMPFQTLGATWQAMCIMRSLKIDVVVGFGGYVCGPGGLAAKILGIPLLIQEQNAVAGMTNKLLSYMAKKICEGFPNTFAQGAKVEFTGNPVRQDITQLADVATRYSQRSGALVVQVIGGSLGAQALNEKLPDIFAQLNVPLVVKHQCGKGHLDATLQRYELAGLSSPTQSSAVQVEVTEFVTDMAQAYSAADVVICRAGASTVTELAVAGIPAVFVPLPSAVDDHQTANAKFLTTQNAAVLCPQNQLTLDFFKQHVLPILNRNILQQMGVNAQKVAQPKATQKVAQGVLSLLNKSVKSA